MSSMITIESLEKEYNLKVSELQNEFNNKVVSLKKEMEDKKAPLLKQIEQEKNDKWFNTFRATCLEVLDSDLFNKFGEKLIYLLGEDIQQTFPPRKNYCWCEGGGLKKSQKLLFIEKIAEKLGVPPRTMREYLFFDEDDTSQMQCLNIKKIIDRSCYVLEDMATGVERFK